MVHQQLLSIRQAAEMTGLRRKVIRDRVTRGDVSVRIVGSGRNTKLRLTESSLIEAGLLAPPAAAKNDATADLITLIREQQKRINVLEDQRFQLAGQLGAALERTLALQNQLLELTASMQSQSPILRDVNPEVRPARIAETPARTTTHPAGPEDAADVMTEGASARTAEVVRHAVARLATSKGAQRGMAGIERLLAIQRRPGKQER